MLKTGELVRAAKPHRCEWCGDEIVKNEHYYFWSVHIGQRYNKNRMHQECYGHYRKTTSGYYAPFVNKRYMTDEEIAAAEEETGMSYTVIVHRSSNLMSIKDDSRPDKSVPAHMFICRVRSTSSSKAVMKAVSQAMNYDLDAWNGSPKHLYTTKPTRSHYSAIHTMAGFPSLIRPV